MATILYSTLFSISLALYGLNKRINELDNDDQNEQLAASIYAAKDEDDNISSMMDEEF